jgi:hypothetical protein
MHRSYKRRAASSTTRPGLVQVGQAVDNATETAIHEAGRLLTGAARLILRRRGTSNTQAAAELAKAWIHSRAALTQLEQLKEAAV